MLHPFLSTLLFVYTSSVLMFIFDIELSFIRRNYRDNLQQNLKTLNCKLQNKYISILNSLYGYYDIQENYELIFKVI